jgi:hypothetical protein
MQGLRASAAHLPKIAWTPRHAIADPQAAKSAMIGEKGAATLRAGAAKAGSPRQPSSA